MLPRETTMPWGVQRKAEDNERTCDWLPRGQVSGGSSDDVCIDDPVSDAGGSEEQDPQENRTLGEHGSKSTSGLPRDGRGEERQSDEELAGRDGGHDTRKQGAENNSRNRCSRGIPGADRKCEPRNLRKDYTEAKDRTIQQGAQGKADKEGGNEPGGDGNSPNGTDRINTSDRGESHKGERKGPGELPTMERVCNGEGWSYRGGGYHHDGRGGLDQSEQWRNYRQGGADTTQREGTQSKGRSHRLGKGLILWREFTTN